LFASEPLGVNTGIETSKEWKADEDSGRSLKRTRAGLGDEGVDDSEVKEIDCLGNAADSERVFNCLLLTGLLTIASGSFCLRSEVDFGFSLGVRDN